MSDEHTNTTEQVRNAMWLGKLGLAMIWTALCGLFWLIWIASVGGPSNTGADPQTHDMAVGMAGCLVTGCMGSVWLAGMVVLLVLYAIVRR